MIIDFVPGFYALLSHVTQDQKFPAKRPKCVYDLKFIAIIINSQNSPNLVTVLLMVRKSLDHVLFQRLYLV